MPNSILAGSAKEGESWIYFKTDTMKGETLSMYVLKVPVNLPVKSVRRSF